MAVTVINLPDFHESILDNIASKLDWESVAKFKMFSSKVNDRISHIYVVDFMAQEKGEMYAFVRSLAEGKTKSIYKMIETYQSIDEKLLHNAVCVSICQKWDKAAKDLIGIIDLPRYGATDSTALRHPYTYISPDLIDIINFTTSDELKQFIVAFLPPLVTLSQNKLLQIACAADNVEMVKYLLNKYDLKLSSSHIWQTLASHSCLVFDFMIQTDPTMKISQRMLTKYINQFVAGNKEEFMHRIFSSGAGVFSTKILKALIRYCCETVLTTDDEANIMLLELYASQHHLQVFMSYCLDKRLVYTLKALFRVSKRIKCLPKHLRMLEEDKDSWTNGQTGVSRLCAYDTIKRLIKKKIRANTR